MGSGRYDSDSWDTMKSVRSAESRSALFSAQAYEARQDYVPAHIKGGIRESVDSADNPNSRPIAIFMDVTGSMGMIPEYMAKQGIGDIMADILKHQPVADPHVLLATFADAKGDSYPLQVAQFEADNRVAEQATNFHLGGGGAQDSESYDYPWLFAATMTKTDAWEKRGQKGYLFTIGDEPAPHRVNETYELERVFGSKFDRSYTSEEMLEMAKERWSVFHIVIEQGARGWSQSTKRTWRELLGPNALFLDDYTKLAQLITAVISVAEGAPIEEVLERAGDARASVARAFEIAAEIA